VGYSVSVPQVRARLLGANLGFEIIVAALGEEEGLVLRVIIGYSLLGLVVLVLVITGVLVVVWPERWLDTFASFSFIRLIGFIIFLILWIFFGAHESSG
jgi:hypothetical protein